jgi:hypothetical protein
MNAEKLREMEQMMEKRKYTKPVKNKVVRLPKNPLEYSDKQKKIRSCIDYLCLRLNHDFEYYFSTLTRDRDICMVRQFISAKCYLVMKELNEEDAPSLQCFGDVIGKNHATLLHSIRNFEEITAQNDPQYYPIKNKINEYMTDYWMNINGKGNEYKNFKIIMSSKLLYYIKTPEGLFLENINFKRVEEAMIFIDGYICGQTKLNTPTPTKHVLEFDTNI